MWSWQRQQLNVTPRNALPVCSIVSSSHMLRLNLYQLRTRKPVARSASGSSGASSSAGEHLLDHPVVGLVRVERLDDPVAPPPDVRLALADLRLVAVPVAVPPDVHPVPAPALAVLRRGEQAIDDRLVVRQLVAQLLRRRRQADQIEIDAPQQQVRRRFANRRQLQLGVLGGDEGVDRIGGPGRVGDVRHRRPNRLLERPVIRLALHLRPAVRAPASIQAPQHGDLLFGQRLAFRRHFQFAPPLDGRDQPAIAALAGRQ